LVFRFTDWSETKKEKAERVSRDAARKEAR
jgi:hypothetical protein